MTTHEPIRALLLEAHPRPAGGLEGDWNDVLGRAGPSRTSRRGRLAAAGAAVAALAAIALLAPFDSRQVDVLDRALAAVGDGPVLHVVLESGWSQTLVDLESGERTVIHSELEFWYDPDRGLRSIVRFDGALQVDAVRPPARLLPDERNTFWFLADYRRVLESGTARIIGDDVMYGIPVHWIRVDRQRNFDVTAKRHHIWAHDVAVSRATFEPVATRESIDGVVTSGSEDRILAMEALPEDAIDFPKRLRPGLGERVSFGMEAGLTMRTAASMLGRAPLWLGEDFRGLPLGPISRVHFGRHPAGAAEPMVTNSVHLYYGPVDAEGQPRYPENAQYVTVDEVHGNQQLWRSSIPRNYVLPPGKALLSERSVSLRKDGFTVSIHASSDALALAAARALEPAPPG